MLDSRKNFPNTGMVHVHRNRGIMEGGSSSVKD